VFRPDVAEIQFQYVVEIPEQQAVDNPTITLGQMAEKKLKLVPAPAARRMPFGEPSIHVTRSGAFAILDFPAEGFGFFGDQAGADAVAGFESSEEFPFGHIFSFEMRAVKPSACTCTQSVCVSM
jgi:hypothetical protein